MPVKTPHIGQKTRNLYIRTYGCQMNVYDSEMISKIVSSIGFKTVENLEEADLVILNTCHIREKAAEKIYSELGKIKAITQKTGKKVITVVAGCVAQAEGNQILKRATNVDIVVGPQSIHSLPELIAKIERQSGKEVKLDFEPMEKFDFLEGEQQTKRRSNQYSAFLSVQEGCDKFCSFCVVPYTRGAEYSRSAEMIYREALELASSGTREITLLGQNVNGYHGTLGASEINLGQLIQYLSKIPSLERIRYTTSHPLDMHEELYTAHRIQHKLMPFIHLPVQSGSDSVLKRMNRKYTSQQYIDIIDRLRKERANIALSSDFIVGFPGESDDDFMNTLDIVERVGYAQCYSFKYSPRPGTPGAEYPQIDEKIKDVRLQKLQLLLRQQQLEFNQKMIGNTVQVYFDKKTKDGISGRTEYMQIVHLNDNSSLLGKTVTMKVTDASLCTLHCEPIDVLVC